MSEARARLDALPDLYPRLFPEGPLPWGFEVGDGWSGIIVALCARIDTLMKDAPAARMAVVQVKEKFGGLRFYYHLEGADEKLSGEILAAVDLATKVCGHVCERCGRHGSLQNRSGWLGTLCEDCVGGLSTSIGS